MKDLRLDTPRHDLEITNYDLSFVEDIDRVRQNLRIRLWFFFEEWFLDTTYGVKYYQLILVKNPNLTTVSSALKATILETEDVVSLLEYTQSFDLVTRKLTVTFTVNTTFGTLRLTEVI